MSRLLVLSWLLAIAGFAQNPTDLFSKAPPAIDEALRDRVIQFYQAHVDGKFRAADQIVAEESKDVFFEMEKRRCNSFEIGRINYKETFTRAQVMILCDTQMMMVPVGVRPVKLPISSLWKQIDGKWFWYVDPTAGTDSPFGPMKAGPMPAAGAAPALTADMMKGPDPASLKLMVQVDRQNAKFNLSQPGEQVINISSKLPGIAKLSVDQTSFPGLEGKLEKTELSTGESAKLTIVYTPAAGRPRAGQHLAEVRLRVEPIGRVFPIQVLLNAVSQ
jgi:hypothetical protein